MLRFDLERHWPIQTGPLPQTACLLGNMEPDRQQSPQGRHQSGDGGCPKADIVGRTAIDRVWDFLAVSTQRVERQVLSIADIRTHLPIFPLSFRASFVITDDAPYGPRWVPPDASVRLAGLDLLFGPNRIINTLGTRRGK